MKGNYRWFLFAAAIFLLFPFSCASRCDDDQGEDTDEKTAPAEIVVTGTISIKGSEPFTYTALTEDGGAVYKITGPLEEELAKHYQYKKVTLAGGITKEDGGPGIPAELLVDKIID